MKRIIFFILLTVIGFIKVSAQEVDFSQGNSTDARIEELSQKIEELSQKIENLQEDYDYIAFTSLLNQLVLETDIFGNKIQISTNEIVVWCYNANFDIDLYLLAKDRYDLYQERYDFYSHQKDFFSKQIPNHTFSDKRQNIVNTQYNMIESNIKRIENVLIGYKEALNVYKKKGKVY